MAVTEFVTIDPVNFDHEKTRRNLSDAVPDLWRDGVTSVISHEALSSRPHHGRYYAPEVARRLKAVFPNGRVLLIFREQVSIISALYVEHVRNGGTHTLEEFVGTGAEPPGWSPLCKLSFFRYDKLINAYKDIFGRSNVLALPFEMLKSQPEKFTRAIFDFSNVPFVDLPTSARSNVTWAPTATELMRRLNRIVGRNPLGPKQPMSYQVARRIVERVNKYDPQRHKDKRSIAVQDYLRWRVGNEYADSNAELEKLVGLGLQDYGYRVA